MYFMGVVIIMVTKCVRACLLDIEGTTTSISFVKDELFPYVLKNLPEYLETHWVDEECQSDIKGLMKMVVNYNMKAVKDSVESRITVKDDIQSAGTISKESVKDDLIKYVRWLMSNDSKATPLKALQGHMWREGYANGTIKGHLYPDVADVLKHWYKQRIKLYIYSSGSVEAQKLLFKHSVDGNLLKFISGHFDTNIGHKRETQSYSKILSEIDGCDDNGSSVLFLTDIPQEARAASSAGLQVLLVCRPGNQPLSKEEEMEFELIKDFECLTLTSALEDSEINEIAQPTNKRIRCEKSNG